MNGKRAKELRRAARLLCDADTPERGYYSHSVPSWHGKATMLRCDGVRAVYRKLKRVYLAHKRRNDPATLWRLAAIKAAARRTTV